MQRKILVGNPKGYYQPEREPQQARLKQIHHAQPTYLVPSMAEIRSMEAGTEAGVPMLAPRKHLIGERHSDSKFHLAADQWSWGAELLIEAYSEHPRLRSPQQEAHRRKAEERGGKGDAKDRMYATAKGLEDLAAKTLTNLVNAQIFGEGVLRLAQSLHKGAFSQQGPGELQTLCENAWKKCHPALDAVRSLSRYREDSQKERGWGIFGRHYPEHDLVDRTLKRNPSAAICAGLDNMAAQHADGRTLHLNPETLRQFLAATKSLVPVYQRLLVAHDDELKLEGLEAASSQAVKATKIGELDPVRERYMLKRIKAAPVPSLVKIGEAHVGNLRSLLPEDAAAYEDYDQFTRANTADRVQV